MTRSNLSIFEFNSFAEYFAAYLAERKKRQRRFSLRYLCRETNIKSPAHLSWIATGKRFPTPDVLEKLNAVIGWRPDEFAYAQSLANYARSHSMQEKAMHFGKMQEIAPAKNLTEIEKQSMDVFMKWHVTAILEMTHLQDFRPDPDWISHRLGRRISPDEVRSALVTLKNLALLIPDDIGGLVRPSKRLATRDNIPVSAVRRWHVEMMRLAQREIHLQDPGERFYSGTVFTIKRSSMAEAQALLAEFRERFVSTVQADGGDETYHFGMQFFRLTTTVSPEQGEENGLEKPEAHSKNKKLPNAS